MMYAKRSLSACLVLGLVLLSSLVVSTQGPVPECPYRGPAAAPMVPPAPTLPARLWIPLVYKNRIVPRVAWGRNGPDENPRYYGVTISIPNPTNYRIAIDRFAINLINADGQVIATHTGEPNSLLWVLDPDEKIGLTVGMIPTFGEVANVQVNIAWHPTDEQFVNLAITEARVIHCSEYGEWDELLIRVRNDTNRVIHQATLLVYGEDLTPFVWVDHGDIQHRWGGKSILFTNIQPGEERQIGTTWCAGEVMWLPSSISSAKCIARLSDTSLP